ncbi:MAG: sulfatase-like hydrolase/transferase [Opitutales bacterium]|nr:sulfatase-like hydrolase/transferase [Opitutales bacterium]
MNTNILYFVCHDLGRALGCYGAGIPTPHLDAFAAQGIRFTNAHCASPACSPSRACAMSGQYAHQTGALGLSHMGWPLHLQHRTTVDDFNAAGYQTFLSGINHERHPRTDRYEVDLTRQWDDWKLPRAVDNALAALRGRDPARPFYLNIGTQEPHACIWKDVGGRIPPMPPDWPGWTPPGMPRTPALEAAFRRFAAAVVLVDQEFGRLLRGLEELGLAANTLVVFTTDHGMSGPRGKGSLYGLGTEIALLMRPPGEAHAGATRSFPVSNISFRATFAEAAGIATVDTPAGRSIWKAAMGEGGPPDDALFLERNFHGEKPWRTEDDYIDCFDPIRAVRTATHLYIRNFRPEAKPPEPLPGVALVTDQSWENWETSWALPAPPRTRPAEELYLLAEDPLELHNLAADPAHAATLAAHRSRLDAWMTATGDFLPEPPPVRPEEPGWGPHCPPDPP